MSREKSRPYPAVTWEECKALLRRIDALGIEAVAADTLAHEYGLGSAKTKSFQYRVSSAKQFGLVDVKSQAIAVTDVGRDLIHPVEEDVRPLELQCFVHPPLYQGIVQKYDDKPLPRVDLLANVLTREFGIAEGAKRRAAECFISTAKDLGVLVGGVLRYEKTLRKCLDGSGELGENVDDAHVAGDTHDPGPKTSEESLSKAVGASLPRAILQRIPLASGGTLEFSIPITATADELILARELFDVLLEKRFGMSRE